MLPALAPTDDDKMRAESIARSIAGTEVVSNEIGVRPKDDSTAKKVDSDLDSGIDKNLEAMLVQHRLNRDVKYDVTNGVVTLKGDVPSQALRFASFALALLAIIALGAVAYFTERGIVVTNWVIHTYQVRSQLNDLQLEITRVHADEANSADARSARTSAIPGLTWRSRR